MRAVQVLPRVCVQTDIKVPTLMERAHARFRAIRFGILQVNDSDNEASAVVNRTGQHTILARAGGMQLAGMSIAGQA